MEFRRDINGLRALAVLAVVFYHFDVFFNGGFVGVDIFFVISGFLMTGIIFNRINNDSFSILKFYLDRAIRIIPALSFLCIVILFVGWFFLIPTDYEMLGEHVFSSMLFTSNVTYFNEVDYFDVSASKKWLLHTWSLSVEWQFYILLPLIIALIIKINKELAKKTLVVIMVVSFSFSVFLTLNGKESEAFYLLPSRAWEMMLGGVVFLYFNSKPQKYSKQLHFISLIGIAISLFVFNKQTSWPGVPALLPTVSAALLIYSRYDSLIISNKISQYIGKTSYSIYLWHWPVVVTMVYFDLSGYLYSALGISFSLFLGSVSFYFIENPLRKALRNKINSIKVEVPVMLLVFIIPLFMGYSVVNKAGYQDRYPFLLLTKDDIIKERARYWVNGDKENPVPKNGDKKIVIIGNSHGIDLTYAMTENGMKGDITYLKTTANCSNFGLTPNSDEHIELCGFFYNKVMNNPSIKNADIILLHDDWVVENIQDLKSVLNDVRSKTNAPIYVFGPKMTYTMQASEIVANAINNKKSTIGMINSFSEKYYVNDRVIKDINVRNEMKNDYYTKNNITYISSLNIQCGNDIKCELLSNSGSFNYFDTSHFTLQGSKDFGEKLKRMHPELF